MVVSFKSLNSLLSCDMEFDLHITVNNSRDKIAEQKQLQAEEQ